MEVEVDINSVIEIDGVFQWIEWTRSGIKRRSHAKHYRFKVEPKGLCPI